jgi:flagellar hook-basal body complex protein FliE
MMDEIKRIQSILQQGAPPEGAPKPPGDEVSFKETLDGFLNDVNKLQKDAEVSTQKLMTGDMESIHQMMVALEEASTSFQLMMEMRNKILEAYREVMRMQI